MIELPLDTASVPAARAFVRAQLTDWPGDRSIVELLTTELATNAVLHAHSPFTVTIKRKRNTVRVEVTDASAIIPVAATSPPIDAVQGRGLFLVATLARRWGTDALARGKRVWFEVSV